jgi:hypothetical protein
MYKTEAVFSSALLKALKVKARRLFIQRIESGETSRGIPDLYIRNKKREYWVELKNISYQSIYDNYWIIPWRPGQIAWATVYYRAAELSSYTIVALKDGFSIIAMNPLQKFIKNTVYPAQCIRMTALSDVVCCIMEGLENYVL